MPLYADHKTRLVSGWKDIGAALLVFGAFALIAGGLMQEVGMGAVMGLSLMTLSWVAAEVVARHYRWKIASTVTVLAFSASLVSVTGSLHQNFEINALTGLALGILLWLFWRRCWVPLAVPLACIAFMAAGSGLVDTLFWDDWHLLAWQGLCGGLILGGAWMLDITDTDRQTIRADISFWLHIVGAWNLLAPVFVSLGYMRLGTGSSILVDSTHTTAAMVGCGLYVVAWIMALLLDRWALIASGSLLVVPAISVLFMPQDSPRNSMALVALGLCVALGAVLLAWRPLRAGLVGLLPRDISGFIPPLRAKAS